LIRTLWSLYVNSIKVGFMINNLKFNPKIHKNKNPHQIN
jgi:hypothetical protein